jgi:SAM-dependent methyltransferase
LKPLLSGWLRRQRLKSIAPFVNGDVLDLGCGHAPANDLVPAGRRYVGVDVRSVFASAVEQCRPGAEFYVRDLERDALDLPGRFDTILMIAIVEHLADPNRVLGQLPGYLAPGGRLLLTTPTPLGHLIHRTGAALGLFYRVAAQEHKSIFTAETLGQQLAKSGLCVADYGQFLLGGNQWFVCKASN